MTTSRKKKKKPFDSTEARSWIMFIFALGLLYGMFKRGDALNAWWTLVIGAMLSLTTLVVAIENIMGVFRKGTDDDRKEGPNSGAPISRRSSPRTKAPTNSDSGGGESERRSTVWLRPA